MKITKRCLPLLAALALPSAVFAQTPPVTPGGTGITKPKKTTPPLSPAEALKMQQEIQDSINKMNAALQKKDLTGVMRYYAPDYKLKDKKGKTYDAAKLRADYTALFAQAQTITAASAAVEKVTPKKNGVEVTGHSTLRYDLRDSKGKMHEVAQTGTGLLTWKKTAAAGWQMVSAKVQEASQTYDGKSYSDTPAPKNNKKSAGGNTNRNNNRNSNSYSAGWRPYKPNRKHKTVWKPLYP